MNREIKFRGISKRTREWVYGYYWTNENGNYFIRQTIDLNGCFSIADIEIDIETIGQYTGLKDKNGREIYEGDILKSMQWNDIYLVKYIGTAFYLCRKGNKGFNKITTWNNAEKSEVIGNITDNPELLGGE